MMKAMRRTTHPRHFADATLHLPGTEQPALCGATGRNVSWKMIEIPDQTPICEACIRKRDWLAAHTDSGNSVDDEKMPRTYRAMPG